MAGSKAQLGTKVSRGWADPLIHAVKTFVVAFVVLQAKEWLDAGRLDTPGTVVDAVWIACGVFLLSAIEKLVRA
jgi:hypothetical protein